MPSYIRIIGGQWKRQRLPVIDAPGLRPTADRVRETLFNWLGQELHGLRCLDMFAGAGALGFEAASRGAAYVLALEQSPKIAQQLRHNRERLTATQIEIIVTDAIKYVDRLPDQSFDVIFLDPPFADNLLLPALQAASRLLSANGFIYVESATLFTSYPDLVVVRQDRAGKAYYCLLRKTYSTI